MYKFKFLKIFSFISWRNYPSSILIFHSYIIIRTSIFYTICNYIVVFILIGTSIYSVLPKNSKDNNKKELITCTGKTESSDNTKVEILNKKGNIEKISYTYVFDIKNKTGAENLVNRFDKSYADFTSIYSEIEISDKVTVKLTYNLDKVDMETVKEIDGNITNDYNELKEKQLNDLTCEIKNVD